jgi:hypothetical protein
LALGRQPKSKTDGFSLQEEIERSAIAFGTNSRSNSWALVFALANDRRTTTNDGFGFVFANDRCQLARRSGAPKGPTTDDVFPDG